MILWGVIGYVDAPAWGRQAGSTVALKKTRTVKHRSTSPTRHLASTKAAEGSLVDLEPSEELDEVVLASVPPEATASYVASSEFDGPSPHQLNKVQQLLAASAQRR